MIGLAPFSPTPATTISSPGSTSPPGAMPMLDRTAAGLEPSGLQRLLPRVPKAGTKPSSALHAFFSQRGLGGEASPRGFFDMFNPELSVEPLNASAVLLDFLYPKGALRFVRRLSLSGVTDSCRRPSSPAAAAAAAAAAAGPDQRKPARRLQSHLSSYAPPEAAHLPPLADAVPRPSAEEQAVVLEELSRLLQSTPLANTYEAFDRAWSLLHRLDDGPEKASLRRSVLHFLTPSRRPADAGRVLRLFDQLDAALWDAPSVAGAIKAQLTLNSRTAALAIFERSAATDAWADGAAPGFDLLLASALQTASWPVVAHVWNVYKAKTQRTKADAALLPAVVGLPSLAAKLQALWDVVGQADEPADAADTAEAAAETIEAVEEGLVEPAVRVDGEALQEAFKAVLEAALPHLDPATTLPMVQALTNPRVLENWIEIAVRQNLTSLAARAYAAYRLMPRFKPRTSTLVSMVRHVYRSENVRGMESVLKDWYKAKGRPNFWGFQKYLAFYAARGDVGAVYRLWSEFTTAYPAAVAGAEDAFAHLLKVHAVRGDLAQVEQTFAEIREKHGVAPNTVCWNIRLHAYVERGDAAQAMRVFEELCAAVAPDSYSFATILALVGARGDLALAIDLHGLARQRGVPATESMLDPLVEAYCQNDRLDAAERLCVTATREAAADGTPRTELWNTLLQHHALRHDLVAVNRVLGVMTRLAVRYNEGTYGALLFALAQCRQPRRAVELLRAAQEDGLFRPAAHHYTLLMMAYIRSRQPHRALQVNRLMHHLGFQRSSQQVQMVIKAFSQWQDYPKGDKRAGAAERRDLFAKALREFQRSLPRGPAAAAAAVGRDAVRMHLGAVRRFSFVVFMLVQARDFAGVEEVMQLYQSIAPAEERQQPLPLKLCSALMLSDYHEGRFDRVKEMWQTILARTQAIARPLALRDTRLPSLLGGGDAEGWEEVAATATATAGGGGGGGEEDGPRVVAKLRYGLSDALKTMQRTYTAERDADGLVRLVTQDVLGNGFLLDSKNWNHYVQNLARLGRVAEAFAVCEAELIPRWSGYSVLRARYRHWYEEHSGPLTGAVLPATQASEDDPAQAQLTTTTTTTTTPAPADGSSSSSGGGTSSARGSAAAPRMTPRMTRLQQIRESAPRYNRPMTYTFMVLTKAYLELEQLAMWSSAAERQFGELAGRSPKTVHAVRTMVRMNSRIEGRVFGAGDEEPAAMWSQ